MSKILDKITTAKKEVGQPVPPKLPEKSGEQLKSERMITKKRLSHKIKSTLRTWLRS